MHTLADMNRLQDLRKAHAEAKARWLGMLASHRDDPDYFDQLLAASKAYTAAADAHLSFWEPAGPDADARTQDETRALRQSLDERG